MKRLKKIAPILYLILIVALVTTAGAIGFYYFENGTNPNVKSYGDCLYWAVVTMATVGYGDIYPMTSGGRVVAILLIFTGIGSLGAFLAIIEAYVLRQTNIGPK